MSTQPRPTPQPHDPPRPLSPPTPATRRNVLDTLRAERTGGVLLVGAALLGLVLANGPTRTWFAALSATELTAGPVVLDVAHWASEWPWCEQAAEVLRAALGGSVEVRVSRRRTDPWTVAPSAGRTP